MTKKQEIYREILRICVPYLRNTLSRPIIYGKLRFESYELAQLIHNLYVSIFEEQFVDHDIWFLNAQAKSFYDKASGTDNYTIINKLISELFSIVPEQLRYKLKWNGPE